jgi:hypothetical protein
MLIRLIVGGAIAFGSIASEAAALTDKEKRGPRCASRWISFNATPG